MKETKLLLLLLLENNYKITRFSTTCHLGAPPPPHTHTQSPSSAFFYIGKDISGKEPDANVRSQIVEEKVC